jgi:hypothetical protein
VPPEIISTSKIFFFQKKKQKALVLLRRRFWARQRSAKGFGLGMFCFRVETNIVMLVSVGDMSGIELGEMVYTTDEGKYRTL